MRLVAKILDHFHSAEPSFRQFYIADSHFRLFLSGALAGVYALATGEHNAPVNKSLPRETAKSDTDSSTYRLRLAAAAIFLETAIQTPFIVVQYFGTGFIVQFFDLFYEINTRIALLFHMLLSGWLDSPRLRKVAELHLVIQRIAAPLIDVGFFQQQPREINDSAIQQMRSSLDGPAHALLNILLTWSGLFACSATDADGKLHASSPFRIIPFLGTNEFANANSAKLQEVIVNACCEFMNAPYSQKQLSSWKEAITFYSEMHLPDAFNCSLRDDFVIEEMSTLMDGGDVCGSTNVDFLQCFQAVGAYALIEAGIIEALCRVITASPDEQSSLKATLLLADLLNLGTTCLPRETRLKLAALSQLVHSAAQSFSQHTVSTFPPDHGDHWTASHWRVISAKSSVIDRVERSISRSAGLAPHSVGPVHTVAAKVEQARLESTTVIKRSAENSENSFLLLDRLNQLAKLTRRRDASALKGQLQNLNIFLLCSTAENQSTPEDQNNFLSGGGDVSNIFVLEQCLLDLPDKLFLDVKTSTTSSSASASTSMPSASPPRLSDEVVAMLQNGNPQQQQAEQQQQQPINWRFVDQVLNAIENASRPDLLEILQKSTKLMNKCHNFFSILCNRFLPSRQLLLQNDANETRLDALYVMNCGRRAYNFVARQTERACRVAAVLATRHASAEDGGADYLEAVAEATIFSSEHVFYSNLLRTFAADFYAQLREIDDYKGTFSPRNLLGSNAIYYFAIVRIVCRQESAYQIFEKAGVFQSFFELVHKRPESVEYVKLILSSLHYERDGISRIILQTAATFNEKKVRKWTTRFLNVFMVVSNSSDVVRFAIMVAVGQLSDESPKVVRLAIQLLLDWMPIHSDHLDLLTHVNFRKFGDAGRLLEGVYAAAQSADVALQSEILHFWMKEMNERFVDIVDEEMRRQNLDVKRTLGGRFGRTSYINTSKRILRPPPHFLGLLARSSNGRAFLIKNKVVEVLFVRLRAFHRRITNSAQVDESPGEEDLIHTAFGAECRGAKAALFAAAHVIAEFDDGTYNSNNQIGSGYIELLRQVLHVIVELATNCEWLSVRGCALWALNIAGRGSYGAGVLELYGWECGHKVTSTLNAKEQFLAKFACGQFFPQRHWAKRQRRQSWNESESYVDIDNHFFKRSASQPAHIRCQTIANQTASAISVDPRERASSTRREKYDLISEDEQAQLISYRGLLSNSWNNGSNTTYFLKSITAQSKKKASLCLPTRVSKICSNIFTDMPPAQRKGVIRSTDSTTFSVHSSLNCIFCSSNAYNVSALDRESQEAYEKYNAEILRLIYLLEVRLTEMDVRNEKDADEERKESRKRPATKSEEITHQTGVALKLQMRLLRIYAEAPKAFTHPCLFSNVLHEISASRLTAPYRRFIHQLFFDVKF